MVAKSTITRGFYLNIVIVNILYKLNTLFFLYNVTYNYCNLYYNGSIGLHKPVILKALREFINLKVNFNLYVSDYNFDFFKF